MAGQRCSLVAVGSGGRAAAFRRPASGEAAGRVSEQGSLPGGVPCDRRRVFTARAGFRGRPPPPQRGESRHPSVRIPAAVRVRRIAGSPGVCSGRACARLFKRCTAVRPASTVIASRCPPGCASAAAASGRDPESSGCRVPPHCRPRRPPFRPAGGPGFRTARLRPPSASERHVLPFPRRVFKGRTAGGRGRPPSRRNLESAAFRPPPMLRPRFNLVAGANPRRTARASQTGSASPNMNVSSASATGRPATVARQDTTPVRLLCRNTSASSSN